MKKLLSLILALAMTFSLAAPAFATEVPPSDCSDDDYGIMPLTSLFDDYASSRNGTWTSSEFTATPSNGNYIRFWHDNTTDEAVRVYLYLADAKIGSVQIDFPVKMLEVPAHSNKSTVYNAPSAGSGRYFVKIEAYVSGGSVAGDVSVAQYTTNPG